MTRPVLPQVTEALQTANGALKHHVILPWFNQADCTGAPYGVTVDKKAASPSDAPCDEEWVETEEALVPQIHRLADTYIKLETEQE